LKTEVKKEVVVEPPILNFKREQYVLMRNVLSSWPSCWRKFACSDIRGTAPGPSSSDIWPNPTTKGPDCGRHECLYARKKCALSIRDLENIHREGTRQQR